MVLGYLAIAMLLGAFAAAISLFLGSSVLLAFSVYSGVGVFSVFSLAAFNYLWKLKTNNISKKRCAAKGKSGIVGIVAES